MKNQVDELLEQFNRQTEQLHEAQAAAAQATATLTSPDGLVTVTVDAAGVLSQLRFAPNTFERSNPESLARTVQDLVRRGTLQVKQQVAELMRPLTEDLPDLSDFIEGAPSLKGLLPEIPDYRPPEPEAAPAPLDRAESFEDPNAGSIMQSGQSAPPPPPPVSRPTPPPPPKPSTRRARPTPEEEDEEPPDSWLTRGRD